MRDVRLHLRALCLVALATMSAAQDDCANPVAISGFGAFPVTTIGRTTSGFEDGVCIDLRYDTFFLWTATSSGYVQFDTCADADVPRMAIYDGVDCTATCRDGGEFANCGTPGAYRQVVGPVAPGDMFLVAVGISATIPNPNATGTLTIGVGPTPPGNDTCATAQAIAGTGVWAYDRTDALDSHFDGGGGACSAFLDNDIFYRWTALSAGNYAFDICGESLNTALVVHDGADCMATCVATYRDGLCPSGLKGQFRLADVQAGDTYLFQIGNISLGSGMPGAGAFGVTLLPPTPANDTCATPSAISGIGSFPFDRTDAISSEFDGGEPACQPAVGFPVTVPEPPHYDVFLAWTPPADGAYRFETTGPVGVLPRLNVYAGDDCSATCLHDAAGTAVTGPFSEWVEVPFADAGTTYLVQIGQARHMDDPDPGVLTITSIVQPPPNDNCGAATVLPSTGTYAWDNTDATTSGFDGGGSPCSTLFGPQEDLFYRWTATLPGSYVVDTFGTGVSTRLHLHEGGDCSATCFQIIQDSNAIGESRALLEGVQTGDTFLMQVGTEDPGFVTDGVLRVAPLGPTMPNDDCSNAVPLVGEAVVAIDNIGVDSSFFNAGDPFQCGPAYLFTDCPPPFFLCSDEEGAPPHQDVFYQWSPTCDGVHLIRTCPTHNTFVLVNLYEGTGCSATCLGIESTPSSACPIGTDWPLDATVGSSYLIQVGMWGPDSFTEMDLVIEAPVGCTTGGVAITCDPAAPHFQGGPVTLATSSFGGGVGSGLHVEATGGPPGEFGFFIISATATSAVPIFNGTLCLDAPIARFDAQVAGNQGLPQLDSIGRFDANGVLENLAGSSTTGFGFDVPLELPYTPAGQMIQDGDTWCLQLWYRDQNPPLPNPGSAANFSDVLVATFP